MKLSLWMKTHAVGLSVLAAATVATAAIVISYTNTSTLTTGVTPPPVQFAAGDDTDSLTDYVTAFSISTNKTYLSTTVKGVPEATLTIGSHFKLTNVDDASHAFTLSTSQVSNAYVDAYTVSIYDGSDTLLGTLDLTAASPTTGSITIPAGETFYATTTLTLATGAGVDNVAETNSLTLSVS